MSKENKLLEYLPPKPPFLSLRLLCKISEMFSAPVFYPDKQGSKSILSVRAHDVVVKAEGLGMAGRSGIDYCDGLNFDHHLRSSQGINAYQSATGVTPAKVLPSDLREMGAVLHILDEDCHSNNVI